MKGQFVRVFPLLPTRTGGLVKLVGIVLLSLSLGIFAAAPAWADTTDSGNVLKIFVKGVDDIRQGVQAADEKGTIKKHKPSAAYDQFPIVRTTAAIAGGSLVAKGINRWSG